MATVRELVTKIGFQISDSPLLKADAALKGFRGSALSIIGPIGIVSAIATTGAAAIFGLVKSAANLGDNLFKASQKIGIGVETLQKFRYAADLADVSSQEFDQSITLLSRKFQSAKDGSKEAADAFKQLKINPKTIKTTDELLLKISDSFANLEDGPRKTALAMNIFSRSGARMIPFLNQGSAKIIAMGKELEELGLIIGADAAGKSEEFNDQLKRLGVIFKGLRTTIGIKFLPIVLNLTNGFLAFIKANKGLLSSGTTEFFKLLSAYASIFWNTLNAVFQLVKAGFSVMSRLAGGAEKAIMALAAAGIYAGIAFGWLNLWPTLIFLIITGVALLYDDWKTFTEGGTSLFGKFWQQLVDFEKWFKSSIIGKFLMNVGSVFVKFNPFGEGQNPLIPFNPYPHANPFHSQAAADIAKYFRETNNMSVQQKIDVNVSTGSDPEEIGKAVGKHVEEHMGKAYRQANRQVEPTVK